MPISSYDSAAIAAVHQSKPEVEGHKNVHTESGDARQDAESSPAQKKKKQKKNKKTLSAKMTATSTLSGADQGVKDDGCARFEIVPPSRTRTTGESRRRLWVGVGLVALMGLVCVAYRADRGLHLAAKGVDLAPSPLHDACLKGEVRTVDKLLQSDLNIDSPDKVRAIWAEEGTA